MSSPIGVALFALLPAMVGPLPLEQGSRALVLAICGGGEATISLEREDGAMPPLATTPCCAKGCRSSGKRKLLDPSQ
ncbi:hypothetical protein [Alteraurantiacibacter aquimixticola]|uniref:Uncharacterized protein n=1 Tax=Alteraurantiacibacter aquimixticola TaxID=2489173 RepID=A0A4T3F657_9SPHN|nr:hypothetical protein [Alteraurantiacibacter aquimixticola]TIX51989.1 hypothetical protein E5222_06045 [Alteraurantiacibacter aquimixticola]